LKRAQGTEIQIIASGLSKARFERENGATPAGKTPVLNVEATQVNCRKHGKISMQGRALKY
jgi:hypothetical protein